MMKHFARASRERHYHVTFSKTPPVVQIERELTFSCIRVRDRTIKRVPGAIGVEVEKLFVKYVSDRRTDGQTNNVWRSHQHKVG